VGRDNRRGTLPAHPPTISPIEGRPATLWTFGAARASPYQPDEFLPREQRPAHPRRSRNGREQRVVRGVVVSGVGTLIQEIEASFAKGTVATRSETLRRITGLFLEGADDFAEPQVEVFDDVLCQLVKKIEREAIVELS